jgi:hypothetical protein
MNTNVWLRETQSFSLETAVNTGSEWTNAEVRQLEVMKTSGKSIKDISVALGRSYYSVATKLISIGFVNHHKKSNELVRPIISTCGNCFTTPSKSGVCLC